MHDELRRAGLRRVRLWTAVLVVVGALAGAAVAGIAAFDARLGTGVVDGCLRTLAVGAGAGALVVVVLLVTATDRRAARKAWPTVPLAPAPEVTGLAEGPAVARGVLPPEGWRVESAAPNVACLPRRGADRLHVVVSSAAEAGLRRDELEALVALQLSLVLDESAQRVRRPLYAASRSISWSIGLALLAAAVATVRHPAWAGLTINLGVWTSLGLVGLLVLVQRRLRWAWGVVGDAVAIETTRHPEALFRALRRLAGHNGPQVPVARSWGAADPYWVVPVRRHAAVSTMVANGRARSTRTTEQVSDAALLLRAGIVERMTRSGDPATLASWREARDVLNRLGRYGATGTGDGTIDGVEVTTEGAGAGALPPVGGAWPSAPQSIQ